MSAFVVSKEHIDALVRSGLSAEHQLAWYGEDPAQRPGETGRECIGRQQVYRRMLDYTTADATGLMLWAENVASVRYRYEDADEAGMVPEGLAGYTYATRAPVLTPVEALKALDCYTYQSCEHPGWNQSEANRFCEALRDDLIGRLPGYAEAPWEVSIPVRS